MHVSVWVCERGYRCLQGLEESHPPGAAVPGPDVGGWTWTWVLWKSSGTCELRSRFSSLLHICFLFNLFWRWSLNEGPHTCSGHILPPGYTCRCRTFKWPSDFIPYTCQSSLSRQILWCAGSPAAFMWCLLTCCFPRIGGMLVLPVVFAGGKGFCGFWSRKTGGPRVQPRLFCVKWKFPVWPCHNPKADVLWSLIIVQKWLLDETMQPGRSSANMIGLPTLVLAPSSHHPWAYPILSLPLILLPALCL